jgi:c-di-GMP-binding flagellar brake protein YcgR
MSPAQEVRIDFERRRHSRFPGTFPIEYWKTGDLQSHPSQAINVSEGGLLIHLSEQPEIGQKLKLNLFIGSSPDLSPVEAIVQVVWKDTHFAEEGDCRAGVKFVDISWKDMEELKNFLNPLLNSKPSQN